MADGYIDLSPIVNAIEHVGDNVSLIGNDLEKVSDNIQVIDGKLSSTQEDRGVAAGLWPRARSATRRRASALPSATS